MMEQHSEAWYIARRGKITASRIYDLMRRGGVESKTAVSYIHELIDEELTRETRIINNEYMAHGTMYENEARAETNYFLHMNFKEIGFIQSAKHNFAGGSPDGEIDNLNAILEIKCHLKSEIHLEKLKVKDQKEFKKKFPKEYWQCVANLYFYDGEICYAASFSPFLKKIRGNFLAINEIKPISEDFEVIEKTLEEGKRKKDELLEMLMNKK